MNAIMSKRERIVEKHYREKNLKLFKRAKELRVLKLLSAKIEITPHLHLKSERYYGIVRDIKTE